MQHECLKCHKTTELPDGYRFTSCAHCGAIQQKVRQELVPKLSEATPSDRAFTPAVALTTSSPASPRVHAVAKLLYAGVMLCAVVAVFDIYFGMKIATSAPQQLVVLCAGLAWCIIPYVAVRAVEKITS